MEMSTEAQSTKEVLNKEVNQTSVVSQSEYTCRVSTEELITTSYSSTEQREYSFSSSEASNSDLVVTESHEKIKTTQGSSTQSISQSEYTCRVPETLKKDDFQVITGQHQQEYICKVEPTEYDLSLDAAVETSMDSKASIGEQILAIDLVDVVKSVPKAISICSKSALVAIDLASNSSAIDTERIQMSHAEVIESKHIDTQLSGSSVGISEAFEINSGILSEKVNVSQSNTEVYSDISESPMNAQSTLVTETKHIDTHLTGSSVGIREAIEITSDILSEKENVSQSTSEVYSIISESSLNAQSPIESNLDVDQTKNEEEISADQPKDELISKKKDDIEQRSSNEIPSLVEYNETLVNTDAQSYRSHSETYITSEMSTSVSNLMLNAAPSIQIMMTQDTYTSEEILISFSSNEIEESKVEITQDVIIEAENKLIDIVEQKSSSPVSEPFIASVFSEAGVDWILPQDVSKLEATLSDENPIPTLIVSEVPEPTMLQENLSKVRMFIAQDSLEIPEIDSREYVHSLTKPTTISEEIAEEATETDEFVVVSNDEVEALRIEEQATLKMHPTSDSSILLPLLSVLTSESTTITNTITSNTSSTKFTSTTNTESIDKVISLDESEFSYNVDGLSLDLRPRNDDGDLLGTFIVYSIYIIYIN